MEINYNENINEEVLAIISAAVAAMSKKTGNKLVVTSLKRLPQSSSAWNCVGRTERLARSLNK